MWYKGRSCLPTDYSTVLQAVGDKIALMSRQLSQVLMWRELIIATF